jgi:hypothetical protein
MMSSSFLFFLSKIQFDSTSHVNKSLLKLLLRQLENAPLKFVLLISTWSSLARGSNAHWLTPNPTFAHDPSPRLATAIFRRRRRRRASAQAERCTIG